MQELNKAIDDIRSKGELSNGITTRYAVEPPLPDGKLNLKVIKTEDGQMWWIAYTSFDEELKGADNIKSTFLTDIDKLLNSALQVDEISGIIINPWNKTLMIDKELIKIIIGKE